jgi:hypothetical protein
MRVPARRHLTLAKTTAHCDTGNCFVETIMTDRPITLDRHRGMAAQKATEVRRLLAEVEANEKSLRDRQEELEIQLVAAPAATWPEAAEKARYLLGLFASTTTAQDPRRKMLIANVLEDFVRLSATKSGESTE